jgi:hypothetical protein
VRATRRGRAPAARSSVRACSASAAAPFLLASYAGDREELIDPWALVRIDRPRCRQRCDRKAVDPAREIAEPSERGGIACVQVVGDEQQRLVLGHRGKQPVEAEGHRRDVCLARTRFSEHRRGAGGRARQPAAPARSRRRPHHGLQQLAHEPEAEIALDLATASPQYGYPRSRRGGGVQDCRLADSRWALEHEHSPVARSRAGEQRARLGQLGVALDQLLGHDAHGAAFSRPAMPVARAPAGAIL